MLRAIPLPGETVWMLKQQYGMDPLTQFQMRMRIVVIDSQNSILRDSYTTYNERMIEELVLSEDWPRC